MLRGLGPGRLILATVVIGVLAGLSATGFHFVDLVKGYWSGLMLVADMSVYERANTAAATAL